MIFKEEPEKLVIELSKRSIFLALILSCSALLYRDITVAVGIIYGVAVSLLLFRLKYLQLQKALFMDEARANTYVRNRYYINYIIYFFVLLTAYRSDRLNFYAVAVGLLLLRYVIIASAIFYFLKEKWTKTISSFVEGRD